MQNSRLIVDVREKDEFVYGHIPGSINIPLSEIEKGNIGDIKTHEGEIVLVCGSGKRAGLCKIALESIGTENKIINGGSWEEYNNHMNNQKNCDYKCESCLMPLGKHLEDAGTERDGVTKSTKYCKYCYQNGKLCYEGNDLKQFQNVAYENMLKMGMWKPKAKFFTWMIKFAPRWKKK